MIADPQVEQYAHEHTTAEPAHLGAVAAETISTLDNPGMMVGLLEGRLLEMLAFATQARRILEIGAFSGYSALAMAAGMPSGGTITTCEIDPRHADATRRNIAASPYAGCIEVRLGDALETLDGLEGPFDLVFIDADKRNYLSYYEAALRLVAATGLIVVDNTLWSGRVLDENSADVDTAALRAFNDHVRADPRVICVQLTVRDGETIIRRAG